MAIQICKCGRGFKLGNVMVKIFRFHSVQDETCRRVLARERHYSIFNRIGYSVHCYLATRKVRRREMAIKGVILVMEDGKVEASFYMNL